MQKRILIGVGIVIVIALLFKFCEFKKEDNADLDYNTNLIQQQIVNVGKLVVTEGHFVPWCGLFMAVVAQRAGKEIPKNDLSALAWANFGVKADTAMLGDVLVFKRKGGGHVGLYCSEDDNYYYVLGGNQGDRVSIAKIDKKRIGISLNYDEAYIKPNLIEVKSTFLESLSKSLNQTYTFLNLTLTTFKNLFTQKADLKDLGGPLAIAHMASSSFLEHP